MFTVPVLDDSVIPGTPTLTVIATEVLPEKLLSPKYCAVI
jgi:hypothetical protein